MPRDRFQEGWIEEVGKTTRKWRGHYFVYVQDENGSEVRKHRNVTLGLKSEMRRREADQKLKAMIAKAAGQASARPDDTVTLEWFWQNRFLPLQTRWRDSTRISLEVLIRKHLLRKFGDTRLCDLKRFDLQSHVNTLAGEFSKSLVAKIKTFMRAILEEALEQEYLTKNPAARLSLPTTRESCKRFLTIEEYHDILGALYGRDRLIFRMFVLGAFRPGELFALRWRCFKGGSVHVEESVFEGKIGKTKTRASAATVVLPKSLAADLNQWYEDCECPDPDELIFPSSAGTPIRAANYLRRDVLRPTAIKLGIKGITFQCLRRTFATHFHRIGTIKDQQTQMRHANAQTTMNVYTQAVSESLRLAMEAFDQTMTIVLNQTEPRSEKRKRAND
jgi:integrase